MYHLTAAARSASVNPFHAEEYADLDAFYMRHPDLGPTPLTSLPAFARALGIAALYLKDESSRFGLNAFKSLGVRYAVDRLQRDGRIADDATLVCASAAAHENYPTRPIRIVIPSGAGGITGTTGVISVSCGRATAGSVPTRSANRR